MTENNVVELPTKQSQEQVLKGLQVMLKKVEKDRVEGLEALEKAIQMLKDVPLPNTSEILKGLEGTLVSLTAVSTFTDMLRQDLGALINGQVEHAKAGFQLSMQLEALAKALIENNVLTTEKLEKSLVEVEGEAKAMLKTQQAKS
jgi:hypothetical protein